MVSKNITQRLKSCIEFWKKISNNLYILSVIEEGYKIPFTSLPRPVKIKNNASARCNSNFIKEEIENLLRMYQAGKQHSGN